MFWLGLILGLFIGAKISLVIYAMIIAGAWSDEYGRK